MQRDREAPVLVSGAGSWGTALAVLLAGNGLRVRLWTREADQAREMTRLRANPQFLPGITLPDRIEPTADLGAALAGVDDVLVAIPSAGFCAHLREIAALRPDLRRIAWATKGFDPATGRLLHAVAADELPGTAVAVISGPTFALEVAKGLPTAVTVAAPDASLAHHVADWLANERFRVYTSGDITGVSVGGAVKNVLAIAAGIADGLGFGANTRAALITRGLAEITRLGVALGGHRETFSGLAGLGDLVLTCTDDQSRNRRLGLALGRGARPEEAAAAIGQVVEGMDTVRAVVRIAREHGIDMPISREVEAVLVHGKAPRDAVHALLAREPKSEDGDT